MTIADSLRAQALPPPPPASLRNTLSESAAPRVRRFALIVTGLTGDEEHAAAFRRNVEAWREELTTHGGVASDRLVILFGSSGAADDPTAVAQDVDSTLPATRENIAAAVADLETRMTDEDSLWVFLQGHGSHDDRNAWLHLPGTDLTAAEWADLFARIAAREQVYWITQSASGGFMRPLSQRGRVVITATAPTGEVNATIFPEVLASCLSDPDASSDSNQDGRISVLELFQAAAAQVAAQYEEQSLAATEHPLLDDNGDGNGTEAPSLEPDAPPDSNLDGSRAAQSFLR